MTPHLIVDGRQEGFIRSLQNGCQVYEEQGACSDIHGAELSHPSLRRLLNFPAHHATIADTITINIPQKQKPFKAPNASQGRLLNALLPLLPLLSLS
jgi:hypothetical protein